MKLRFALDELLVMGILLTVLSGSVSPVLCASDMFPAGYIGNKESLKFHRLDCPFARIMARFRRQYFCNRKTAKEAGMKACRYCLPGVRLRVKARLLHVP